MVGRVTEALPRAGAESRVRRTTVPHPQRWRSPHEAGWADRAAPADAPASESVELAAATPSPFGATVRRFRRLLVHSATPDDGSCWQAAKRAELDIFAVRNGWATDASRVAGEVLDYAPFEARSQIFVATSVKDPTTAVGVARMIWGTDELPLDEQFVVTGQHRIDPEWRWMLDHIGGHRIAEWATLGAVGANLSPMFALWAAAYREARDRGVDYWLQSVVEELFSVYRGGFKTPMMQIGAREIVVGAESIPTVLSLDEIGVGRMLSWNPDLKRSLFGAWTERRVVGTESDPDDLRIA